MLINFYHSLYLYGNESVTLQPFLIRIICDLKTLFVCFHFHFLNLRSWCHVLLEKNG